MAEIENEPEEKKKGEGGNKNAIAYGLLIKAGYDTDGMTPSQAWSLVNRLHLLDRQGRKKNKGDAHFYDEKSQNAKIQGITKDSVLQKAAKISYRIAIHTNNVADLNAAIDTLSAIMDEYDLEKLHIIQTKQHIGKSVYSAAASANGKTLTIGNQFLNNPRGFWRNSVLLYNNKISKQLETYKINLDKAIKSNADFKSIGDIKQNIKNLEESVKYMRHNVCYEHKEAESVVSHEAGHILADQLFGQINGSAGFKKGVSAETAKRKQALVEQAFKDAKNSGDIYKISEYASSDAEEFFAECFAIRQMGKEQLPPAIEKMMKEVLEK